MRGVHPFNYNDRVRAAALQQNLPPVSPGAVLRHKKDRHGRGMRGPLLFPGLPAWRTRKERFYNEVARAVDEMASRVPEVRSIEFGIQDVPPSSPAQWEPHDVVLCRIFPRDRKRGLRERIVLYRLPLARRTTAAEQPTIIRLILAQQTSQVLLVSPEELLGY